MKPKQIERSDNNLYIQWEKEAKARASQRRKKKKEKQLERKKLNEPYR